MDERVAQVNIRYQAFKDLISNKELLERMLQEYKDAAYFYIWVGFALISICFLFFVWLRHLNFRTDKHQAWDSAYLEGMKVTLIIVCLSSLLAGVSVIGANIYSYVHATSNIVVESFSKI